MSQGQDTVSTVYVPHRPAVMSTGDVIRRAIVLLALFGPLGESFAQSQLSPSSSVETTLTRVFADQSLFGKTGFIEYVVGNLPLVISVPHGGYLKPSSIPDRVLGTTGHQDTKTQELARDIIEAFRKQTGKVPHVIINRLHRDKLDANRELFDASQDDPIATDAWNEFHSYIDSAEQRIQREFGKGLYIDLHGHRHDWQVIELGYLLVSDQLTMSDAELDASVPPSTTSLGLDIGKGPNPLPHLVRGTRSLGAALEQHGFPTVPSPAHPNPNGKPYFSGGYNLEQHSAFSGRNVWGIQVELPTGIRDDDAQRHIFAAVFVKSMMDFLSVMGE